MTYVSGLMRVDSKHRLFESLRNVVLVADAVSTAVAFKSGTLTDPKRTGSIRCPSTQFDKNIILPSGNPVSSIVTGKNVDAIEIEFAPKTPFPTNDKTQSAAFYPKAILNIVTPVYVDFYERYRPWIEENQPDKPEEWEPPLNFCRMIRNWISHHHGQVYFKHPEVPAVHWYALTYSHADNGKQVVGGDLDLGDMIVLLFELSDTLDKLGCPLDLQSGD